MKRILHILKKKDDSFPLKIIRKEAESNDVSVILLQDAVSSNLDGTKAKVFVLLEDAKNQKTYHPQISQKEMLDFIFNADTVVTW